MHMSIYDVKCSLPLMKCFVNCFTCDLVNGSNNVSSVYLYIVACRVCCLYIHVFEMYMQLLLSPIQLTLGCLLIPIKAAKREIPSLEHLTGKCSHE